MVHTRTMKNSEEALNHLPKVVLSEVDVAPLNCEHVFDNDNNSSGVAKQVLQIRKYLCVHGDANGGNKTKGKTLDAETTAPAVVPLTANVPVSINT